jgi:hypothetical protein
VKRTIEVYDELVRDFRQITSAVHDNGRCCMQARGDAQVPECCYQIVDGEQLTFTLKELAILFASSRAYMRMFVEDETQWTGEQLYLLNREYWNVDMLVDSMHGGLLANTLECASHPTRPLLGPDGGVMGVAVIDGCNRDIALDRYRAHRDQLRAAWEAAVTLTGVKAYYGSYEIRKDWVVL